MTAALALILAAATPAMPLPAHVTALAQVSVEILRPASNSAETGADGVQRILRDNGAQPMVEFF